MTISEFIKKLEKLDPNMLVIAGTENTDYLGEARIEVGYIDKDESCTPHLWHKVDFTKDSKKYITFLGQEIEVTEGILIYG